MWLRSSLPLSAVTLVSLALAASMFAQQVPNPVLPGPSGTGDGLTRDALDATPAATPEPTNTPAARTTASSRRTARRTAAAGSTRRTGTYATISRRHRHRRTKKRDATMIASTTEPARKRAAAKPRAPLVSFIYWWNGWVVRTFHTRSGTVLLDTIGAKS